MANDLFDAVLDLEENYYKEGFDAGVSDSSYAGMIEGKVFGVEKGYEKALELGKLNGRATVWQSRSSTATNSHVEPQEAKSESSHLATILQHLSSLSSNIRLGKHIDSLQNVSDGSNIAKNNSDEAVTDFDDRIAKARAKAKVIANTTGEELNPANAVNGIEDATGLQARH
jgi:hypothetical protein